MEGENIGDLTKRQFNQFRMFLSPWLHDQTLTMLVGPRGSGKSWVAMGIGQAVSSGASFGPWKLLTQTKVLYLEGEMPLRVLAKRFAQINTSACFQTLDAGLTVVSCDHFKNGKLPNFADPKSHSYYTTLFQPYEVIIIDNLLNCASPIDKYDNDFMVWRRTSDFLKEQRNKGKAIILIHHTGKDGNQYGTSLRENDVDTFIILKPDKNRNSKGFGCELTFEKGRHLEFPENKAVYVEYSQTEEDGKYHWLFQDPQDRSKEKIQHLLAMGTSPKDIAESLGLLPYEVRQIMRKL